MHVLSTLRAWAHRLKRDALTLWFAQSHPDMPWHAKAIGALVVAYALSPIDLIPDFIPVLGFVDDVLLLPALIALALRLTPAHVIDASRVKAEHWIAQRAAKPRSLAGAVLVASVWLLLTLALTAWAYSAWHHGGI